MNVYEKIMNMSIGELAEFMRVRFDSEMGSRVVGIGCSECINYQTHHYPSDCQECVWLDVENDYVKWLEMDSDVELSEVSEWLLNNYK